ncbi:flavin reductase family protein [Streptomyces sp. 4N509B]|uniref:flavin reductase family protein n=1 Tax=Streptomyces sp. 4N509B TaxID=3457413 RepID=UPI003FD51E0D
MTAARDGHATTSAAATATATAAVAPRDPDAFRTAMARFAAGVVVVTTRDADGQPKGFTATSFCSVSLDPPLILVCLAETSSSFQAFTSCDDFAVSVLHTGHTALATRFATTGADKFRAEDTTHTPRLLPAVVGALSTLECEVHDRHQAGDHMILVGAVTSVRLGDAGDPLVYHDRSFSRLRRLTRP